MQITITLDVTSQRWSVILAHDGRHVFAALGLGSLGSVRRVLRIVNTGNLASDDTTPVVLLSRSGQIAAFKRRLHGTDA
jgi:hypothetical protein